MFERYAETARRLIFAAEYEAALCGSPQVEPEHLLLAVLKQEDDAPLCRLLTRDERKSIATQITERLQTNHRVDPKVTVSMSLPMKVVLAQSMEASEKALESRYIGPEHVLLGLLKEPDGVAARLLKQHGIARDRVLDELGATWPVPPRR